MDYIRVTKENIDRGTHLLCHVRQTEPCQKEWLKQRFEEGLVFTAVQSAANALSSTSRQKTHGYPLMQQAGFISTVCGSPVP